jgi:hypothetical protein
MLPRRAPHTPGSRFATRLCIFIFENPGSLAPDNFTYASWEQAFREIARLAKDQRLALFIDEFMYLLEVDPSLACFRISGITS